MRAGATAQWWHGRGDHDLLLQVYVQPRASRNRILGLHDGALKVAVTAPPVDSKANKAVLTLLARELKLAKGRLSVLHGRSARRKQILISSGATEDGLGERLTALAAGEKG